MGSRGYFMTIKWYENRSLLFHFCWINILSCCEQFTKSPKRECNPVLTVAPLFCYYQIGHKEQAGKSVGKTKIGAWHSKLCNTEIQFTFMMTHLITFSFLLRKTDWACTVCLANNWYPVITDRTSWLKRVAGQRAFPKIEMVWGKWKCNARNVM